ncbi:MAG: tRNA pseudouridine(55) synthase TruB [Eubacteriales bacterium]|nr:tRNA pseudouridine(55) synthase TruB [Eubacteriales bacterium]
MDGILVINKEKGFTSHDVVAKLRGILHMKKIGHTGTLDPDATGVLPVALGKGTKLVEFLTEKQKGYEAVLHLGLDTDTQDITGTILTEKKVEVSEEQIRETIAGFLGPQLQIPPMYSALKVNGKKLYELAREGIEVERKARPVEFYSIEIKEIKLPFVKIDVLCSKGTYIRTLCHDIGEKLGCGACMESLCRTKSGAYLIKDSLLLAEVEAAVRSETIEEYVIPVEKVLAEFPVVNAVSMADRLLDNGNPVGEHLVRNQVKGGWVRMYKSDGSFVGLYEWKKNRNQYFPYRIF